MLAKEVLNSQPTNIQTNCLCHVVHSEDSGTDNFKYVLDSIQADGEQASELRKELCSGVIALPFVTELAKKEPDVAAKLLQNSKRHYSE